MATPRDPEKTMAAEIEFSLRVAVKFKDHVPTSASDLTGLRIYLQGVNPGLPLPPLYPLIELVTETDLSQLIARARHNDPSYDPPDFSLWKQLVVPPGADPVELVRALLQSSEVETAHVMRPTKPPVNNPLSTDQGYLNPAEDGIDSQYARTFPGGDGAGIGFVDVEQGWNFNHQDLPAGLAVIPGSSLNFQYMDHGTAVLGVVLMADNGVGGIGIAPSCTPRVVSQLRLNGSFNTTEAITSAAVTMNYGDVLLIEAQDDDPIQNLRDLPVEIFQGAYDAIRLATAAGIVVVEAAGNGQNDLDSYADASAQKIFDRNLRDSGAILVGAASAAGRARTSSSNYGTRIDCFAWGNHIRTARTDVSGTDDTSYLPYFDGTSGAAAIVAGAALSVQGLAQASLGYRFSPSTLRQSLAIGGTPAANGLADKIGVMPNLRAVISSSGVNIAPDLYLRDDVSDTGDDPTSGLVCWSPDIIVRQAPVQNPDAAFGAGSGTENNSALSDNVDPAVDQSLYVRVLNRGGTPASGASVDLYWAPSATLVTPNLWNRIGTATLAMPVPTGRVFAVSPAVPWASVDIPGPGHYCFVAVAGNAADPKPVPGGFISFDQFVSFVQDNNNIAWRNFDVVTGPAPIPPPPVPFGLHLQGLHALSFLIPGAFDTRRPFEFETIGGLPAGSRAFLRIPAWLAGAISPHPAELFYDNESSAWIPLNTFGVQKLGGAFLNAGSLAACTLVVSIPEELRGYEYHFAVRQLYKGWEAGRVTWRFAALLADNRSRPRRER